MAFFQYFLFLFSVLLGSLSAAEICKQRADTAIVVGFDYGAISKRERGIKALPSISNDRREFAEFYNQTYGVSPKSTFLMDDQFYSKAGSTSQERKGAFLNALKRRATIARRKNPTANVNLALAGHGIHCIDKDGVRRWCFVLPEALTKNPIIQNINGIDVIDLREDKSSAFVTDKELYDATEMDSLLIDGCYSSAAIKNIEIEHQRHGKVGLFAFASTSDHLLSPVADMTLGGAGGHLISLLKGLSEARGEDLCKLDLDDNGEVSEREAAFAFQLHGLTRRLGVISLGSLPAGKEVERVDSKAGIQNPLLGAVASNQCLVRVPASVPCDKKRVEEDPYDLCGSYQKKVKAMNKNIEELFKDTTRLNFLSPGGSAIEKADSLQATKGSMEFSSSNKKNELKSDNFWSEVAEDSQRAASADYILKWAQESREMMNIYCGQDEPTTCPDHDKLDERIREFQKAIIKYVR